MANPVHQQYRHTLANGLTILAEHHEHAHSFAAGLFVRTGSRDEAPQINGVSHFLEHMMFKGSEELNWEDINRVFDELGARYNAFTSHEVTAYYANVLPEFTRATLEHLGQLLRPALREADFTTEKNVILEEIAMYEDDPGHRVYDRVMAEHFGEHPLGMSILGPAESIRGMSREQMHDYFSRHYGPAAMVLSVAGRFDFGQIVRLAEEFYGDLPGSTVPRRHPPTRHADKRIDLHDPKLNRTYVMGLTPGPGAADPLRFAARVLGDIVGDAEGSRFYWALVHDAIADEAEFGFYPHDGCGSFYISLSAEPDRTDRVLQIARETLAGLAGSISDAEIDRARNKLAAGLTLSGESPMGRMRSIGQSWAYTGQYRTLESDMESLLAVDRATIARLLETYPLTPFTIVTLGPPADASKN